MLTYSKPLLLHRKSWPPQDAYRQLSRLLVLHGYDRGDAQSRYPTIELGLRRFLLRLL